MGELRGGKPEEIDEQIDYLFSALDILEWANTPGNLLSGGIKRLTAFCMAVICAKDFIILDEPTNDVDPVRRKRLWQEIKRMTAKGCGVIVVTHNILELESVADIVTIIDDGKLISTGTITDIKSRLSNHLKLNLHYDDEGTAEKAPHSRMGHIVKPRRWHDDNNSCSQKNRQCLGMGPNSRHRKIYRQLFHIRYHP